MGTQDGFRALVEHAPDAIVVSRDGIVLYANAAAARLLGHADASDLVGKPMTFLDRRAAEVMQRRIEQMAATGEALIPREYPARRRDGTQIMAEIASTIIPFDGAPAVLAYARDVTDRTRLRAQLAQSDRLASLGTMAAGVAHEINNPLAVITLAADALDARLGASEAALVSQVRAGIDRIAAIVRDLRFFGRDEDEAPGPVDVRAAIDAAERLVAHELRPRGELLKEYGEIPAVMGIRRHVEQVFVNLLLNAAHALDDRADGRVVIRATITDQHVVVSVEDDGCGMPQEILDAIFEPFFTTRAAAGGTGLGLSICRDMVVRRGGDLVARSTVGVGTTMEVTLPLARREPPPAAPIAEAKPEPRPRTTMLRVLVVDDEPLIVRSLTGMLGANAAVTGETAPSRALELILADPPFDVVVCDVMMPGMSGADIHARVVRERPALASRFVFITGGAYTTRTREYVASLPNACLTKPFDVAELLAAVERAADR
jgi:PAS domain S-box-containing protein